MELSPAEPLYARLLPRFQALVIDLCVYVGATVVFVMALTAMSGTLLTRLVAVAWVAGVILYEPVMVWRWGGTLGHMRLNLRVAAESGENPTFGAALIRWLVKGLVGLPSFFWMALTQRHQALHDTASRTTVQPRHLERAAGHHFAAAREAPTGPADVSVRRRVVTILAYEVLLFIAISIASSLAVSEACVMEDLCTPGENLVYTVVALGWLIAAGVVLVLGWKGLLPGARSSTNG